MKRYGIAVKLQFPLPDDGLNNWTALDLTWFFIIIEDDGSKPATLSSSIAFNLSILDACNQSM